ncbi:MAG: leucyl aminopeptidase family protein [Candidatus Eisenbacteria bacterium]
MRPTRCLVRSKKSAIPLTLLSSADLKAWKSTAPKTHLSWVLATDFQAKVGQVCLLPGRSGGVDRVLAGVSSPLGLWDAAALPTSLPAGAYQLDPLPDPADAERVALAWALATYTFETYKKNTQTFAQLLWPKGVDRAAVERTAAAVYHVRDLINLPAEDLGPAELASYAKSLATELGAKCTVIKGEELLRKNYPSIHTVGRAATREPRLIDLRWSGSPRGKKITLVGKGVVFDSGGLDIKSAAGMRLMKKDMGGSAHVIGLASMIISAKLPVQLRVLVPAVENAISGNAFRPQDVIRTRKGITVEVGNTDAEGRLVLADALTEADSEDPDLIVDFATLTGAARIALGTDLPGFFSRQDALADALSAASSRVADPVWRMPMHTAYREMLESPIADLNNAPEGGYGGAITAALFLGEFVRETTPWLHVDLMAWNLRAKPGRPAGGEAMGLRAMYSMIESMVGTPE